MICGVTDYTIIKPLPPIAISALPNNMSNRINVPEMREFGELDLLADVLADSHRGIVYARRWYPERWALDIDGTYTCAFYAVTAGELIIRPSEGDQQILGEGDVALVAGHHILSSDHGTKAELFSIERARSLAVTEAEGRLCMLSWAYIVDAPDHPIFACLPPIILMRAGECDPSVDVLIGLLDREFKAFAPGGRTIASRLIDAMLVCILRHWIATDGPSPGNWIRGLRDPVLARALALIHHKYASRWTLDSLASAAGASRATLARNFVAAVGTTPMRFLAERRLSVAEGLIHRTTKTLEEIAGEVGYGSAFSLSKAFKREFGAAPANYKRPSATNVPDVAGAAQLFMGADQAS